MIEILAFSVVSWLLGVGSGAFTLYWVIFRVSTRRATAIHDLSQIDLSKYTAPKD